MSRKHLTKQQHRQIAKSKQNHLEGETDLQEGLVIAHYGKSVIIKSLINSKPIECTFRQNLGAIVCGDIVYWKSENKKGIILGFKERHSILGRTNKAGIMKPLAANVDQVLIVTACKPALSTYLIDSYLVACETLQLKITLVLNKTDLIEKHDTTQETIAYYENLGYNTVEISAINQINLSSIESVLQDKTNVLVGQSGVGKSTLINALIPNADIETQTLSQDLGTHTTTTSVLHELTQGGAIIDSPGVREFGLGHLNVDAIYAGFTDFAPFKGQCKFRNCKHEHEPDCQLLLAVKEGKIAKFRLENYHKIIKQFGRDL